MHPEFEQNYFASMKPKGKATLTSLSQICLHYHTHATAQPLPSSQVTLRRRSNAIFIRQPTEQNAFAAT